MSIHGDEQQDNSGGPASATRATDVGGGYGGLSQGSPRSFEPVSDLVLLAAVGRAERVGCHNQMASIRSHRERAPGSTWRLLAARGRRSSDGVQFGVQTMRKGAQVDAT